MTNNPAGFLPLFAYVAIVAASVPTALLALVLSRYTLTFRTALIRAALTVVALLVTAVAALAVLIDPVAALLVLAALVAEGVVLGVFPLYIGQHLVARVAGVDPDGALRLATAGWPVALVATAVVFVAPGGVARYNLAFVEGPLAVAGWLVVFLTVTLGPGVAGVGLSRLFARTG